MTFTKNIGMLLLAIYLILVGLIGVFGFHFGFITGIIAFIAGIFILLGSLTPVIPSVSRGIPVPFL